MLIIYESENKTILCEHLICDYVTRTLTLNIKLNNSPASNEMAALRRSVSCNQRKRGARENKKDFLQEEGKLVLGERSGRSHESVCLRGHEGSQEIIRRLFNYARKKLQESVASSWPRA